MNWKEEWKYLVGIAGLFLVFYYLPVGQERFDTAVYEALSLAKWYAREHVILCLIPAFFIAGAISVFVSQASVMRYLGPSAPKVLAYGVASVSGTILAVCSCTVLPLFMGIYRMGAGLGPAVTFLYSGPAINVLAIILTARVLGMPIGLARALGAVVFSIVIGLLMHLFFRHDEDEKSRMEAAFGYEGEEGRPLWQEVLFFAALVGILVSANWASPSGDGGLWAGIYRAKWLLTSAFALGLGVMLVVWFELAWWKVGSVALATGILALAFPRHPEVAFAGGSIGLGLITATSKGQAGEWFSATWGFAKQILPLLLGGVLVAGFLFGRPGHEGVIPATWVYRAVGGNSIWANFFAALSGAFMYFATLTEVPILQGLLGNGMGNGPALALLLAGPALSLPNMLVIRSVLGTRKTVVFVSLVVVMATITGMLFGVLV
ncbi:permease [Spirochaeta thermophila]|uniref:Transporter n=1 Tax=Winmispira thermophila (strain ATCC 49972 / DSM 6192 / RI 19.B1) TaxID=665571 RepID=E0RSU9_WINT6|nr:permease [Spirochaeta thermophila]ADN02086.1 transporter [Spirochaeta thermophila DSM 6192]